MSKPSDQPKLIEVLQKRAQVLRKEGKLEDAVRVALTAVETARKNLIDEAHSVAELVSSLFLLADLKRQVEDYESSESAYLEALSLSSEYEGDPAIPSLQVARIQSGLASLYDFTSRLDRAAELYQLAIHRLEANDPPLNEEAAYLYNNVAMIFKDAENYEHAETFYQKALEAFEKDRGENDETVATVLNNLGGLYIFMNDLNKAREIHLRALKIREQIFPKDHPDLAQSHCNLATVYHQLGDVNNARKHYDMALKSYEKDLDQAGEDYVILVTNYTALLRESGQEKKAEAMEKRLEKVPG